jgi:hypothetical protein
MCIVLGRSGYAQPVKRLTIEPSSFELRGPRAFSRVLVTGLLADGSLVDLTGRATLRISAGSAARIDPAGNLRPVEDGECRVQAAFKGASASAPVKVVRASEFRRMEFAREISPILSRAGCNQGACHGAQYGKGGFKLSLFGAEPEFDYEQIAHASAGRRIHRSQPERSLILTKPALQTAHLGGLRLKPGTPDYVRFLSWLKDGAPAPSKEDPEVTSIQVFPSQRVLKPKSTQTLVVTATYTDGTVRDVTPWARITSLNDAIVSVSPKAVAASTGRGEAAVVVRFAGQTAVSRFTTPFSDKVKPAAFTAANYIDTLVARKWAELGLAPSGMCDDATFLRRASLDIIGTPPTLEEQKAFSADTDPKKREKLVDALLQRPEYADYWTVKWGDLLRSNRTGLTVKGMWSLTNWIREQMRTNRRFDEFAKDLVTAQGSTFTDGPANYFRVASNPNDLAETTAQVLLGTRLQCAKCHHHPFEKWSQADYYRFAAFFARVGIKGSQEFGIFGGEQVVRVNSGGEVYHPKTSQLMKPQPLGGYRTDQLSKDPKSGAVAEPDADARGDRRVLLGEWLAGANPFFAKNIVNRYWGYLMGRGLVEPIDDQRLSNPPTNPELLDALAKDFAENGYDVKRLIRQIATSKVYQLASEPRPGNPPDSPYYTHYLVKRMPAEVLLDSMDYASGIQEKFPGLPLGTRAIQIPDPQVASEFLDLFGRSPRATACECDRQSEPNMAQALNLMMGNIMNRRIAEGGALVPRRIAEKKTDAEIIDEIYRRALARPPKSEEQYTAQNLIKSVQEKWVPFAKDRLLGLPTVHVPKPSAAKEADRKAVLEDIFWAVLNSKSFSLIY